MEPNCNKLAQLNDFSDYVDALRSETRFNEDRLEYCKDEICIAVYGTGNPDISGIGVCGVFPPWLNSHLQAIGCHRLHSRVHAQYPLVPDGDHAQKVPAWDCSV